MILRFYYDYVDPGSFLLEYRLLELEPSAGWCLALEPFELSPPPAPRMDPAGTEWAEHWKVMTEAGGALGKELRRPGIVPWSRKAHELALQAKARNCFREIHNTLYRAYLSEGMDIGRVDVLVDLARRHGLDPMETKAALDVDRHRESVLEKRKSAVDAGVSGSPALLWQGRTLVGYPDEQTLREFLTLDEPEET